MNTTPYTQLIKTFCTVIAALSLQTYAHANVVTLNPLLTAPAVLAVGGLAGNWYKIDNNAKFSNAQWNGETIKDTNWGTGIWSVTDIAGIAANPAPAYVTGSAASVGAVSYANNIYNNTYLSGAYGTWGTDYVRPLAPMISGFNTCNTATQNSSECANEQNYAAIFTGYIYVATSSYYDFGVFADDVFNFSLTGSNGMYGMSHDNVAGSPGRLQYSLLDKNSLDGLELLTGFYAIELAYANRLESGVIDLGWKGPGNTGWRTVDGSDLYRSVPEPATLTLLAIGMMGIWRSRRRRA